jgi:hypothetical protein
MADRHSCSPTQEQVCAVQPLISLWDVTALEARIRDGKGKGHNLRGACAADTAKERLLQ